ncbi:MAG: sugar transferase, partial [Solirubrobacteraceae bacterium]
MRPERLLDLVLAVVLLVCLSPVLLITALAVKLDSRGPVLFRQRRIGLGQRTFTMLKFRSMAANADSEAHRRY